MKILHKSMVIIASAVIVSVVGTYTASLYTLLNGYLQIEDADTRANAERAVNVFNDQSKGILISARAYAVWDDMYRTIQRPDPAFIQSLNLNPQLFKTHNANFIAILDENYNSLFQGHIDLLTMENLPVPGELGEYLKKSSPFMAHSTEIPEILGMVLVEGKHLVLASLAGMHTDFTGPPKGAVVFGRYVDDQTALAVGQAAKMEVGFFRPEAPENPPDVRQIEETLDAPGGDESFFSLPLDSQRIAGYSLQRTKEGSPAFILRVILPRVIYAQGLTSFTYFSLYAGISGIVFLLVLFLLMRNLILSRLTDLGKQVRAIQLQTDDSRRVSYSGTDEIADLAQDINGMLASLEIEKNKLLQANQELEAFTYSLTHHIKAPILSIGGFAGLLKQDHKDCLDEKGRHFVQRIADSSAGMAKLVGDLIDYSQAGKLPFTPINLDFSGLSARISEEFRALEPARKVEVMILPGMVAKGDEKLLRILLTHLFHNAFKFTSKCETGRIEVGAKTEGNEIVFFMKDNGAGFDMKYADQLFLPFHQLHNPGDYQGTGLGLAVAQRVISRHGGKIWAVGDVGKGSNFYFTLEEK